MDQPALQRIGVGSRIAGHEVIGTIGQGGMGVVYLAVPDSGGERVALKVLAPELVDDDAFRRRFERESGYMRLLRHPHIVEVRQAGESEGLLYIAMQYVDGPDLGALIAREGPLEPRRALDLLGQIAGALDAAHASGVVHRDVKPANVIVAADPADSCYVTDFGLSKRIAQDSVALTAADSYVGSFHYVAPEAFNGGECDHRADVYSLGCVLCECLTGAPPFPATREIEVLYAHLKSPPPLLSTLRPDLPAALDEVLATAMAKDPADRYASCLAIVHAARMAIGDEFGQAQAGHDDAPEAVELRFEVISGNLTGTVIEVGDELHIGRAADGHGQLGRDPEISRFHARIAREADGTYAIEDLGSTNGTFVNGLRISSPCILRVGDTLEVGGTTLLAAAAAAAATTAPAGPTPEPPADAGPPPGAPPDVGPTPHAGFPAAHSSVRRVPSALAPAPAPSPPAPEPPLPSELPSTEATPAAVRIDRGAVPPPLSLSLAVDFERADVHLTLGPGMPALHLGFRDGGWQVLDPD